MDLRLVSDPLTQEQKLGVVSVADVKAQARIITSAEDALIADYIETAYDHTCSWLNGACLLNETWEFYPGARLGWEVEFPRRPFVSLTSFEALGADGTTYGAVATNLYRLQRPAAWSAFLVRAGYSPWPYVDPLNTLAFRIQFVAGYGTSKESIPAPLRQAIKMLAAEFYRTREPTMDGASMEAAYGFQALAGQYRYLPDHS